MQSFLSHTVEDSPNEDLGSFLDLVFQEKNKTKMTRKIVKHVSLPLFTALRKLVREQLP